MRKSRRRRTGHTSTTASSYDELMDRLYADEPESGEDSAEGYLKSLQSRSLVEQILSGIDYSFLTQRIKNKWVRKVLTRKTIPVLAVGAYSLSRKLWDQLHKTDDITVTINEYNQSQAFGALLSYLQSKTDYFEDYLTQLDMKGTLFYDYINQNSLPTEGNESTKKFNRTKGLAKEFIDAHLPSNYLKTITYNGVEFTIEKVDQQETNQGKDIAYVKNEASFAITTKRENKSVLTQFLNDVVNYAYNHWLKSRTSVFTPGNHGWQWNNELTSRPLDSVFIPDSQKKEILLDLNRFKVNKNKLLKKGLNLHRAYLFHGVPGSGKTTLIKALATHLDRNVYFLPLGSELTNKDLNSLLAEMEEESILVLEEIDVVFDKREAAKGNKVSFDILLNMLDGLIAKKNLITFITTNHYHKIDPALLRAGRISMEVKFDYIQEDEIIEMVGYWYSLVLNEPTKKTILKYFTPGKYRASLLESFIMSCADWDEFWEKLPTFKEYVKLNHESDLEV